MAFSVAMAGYAQPPAYAFQAASGTYTPLSGGTPVALTYNAAVNNDDGMAAPAAAVPIGFLFTYNGVGYTTMRPCANGFASFSTTALATGADNWTNALSGGGIANQRPLLAPLWDDLDMGGGSVTYALTGASPARVLTIEWANAKWDYGAAGAVISFQLKLYETTNVIEFVYRPEAAAIANVSGAMGASIGISATATGSNSFQSLSDAGASPLVSFSSETATIASKPASGQIYRWIPYCAAGANNTTAAGEKIANVSIGTINNNSTSNNGYENFSAQNAFIIQGSTVPLSISVSNPKATDQAYVWIDFNHNGVFTDAGELVYTSPVAAGPYTTTLSIPALGANVLPGYARMRVRVQDTNVPTTNNTACGTSEWGQVEDYTLDINNCSAAGFTAQPTAAVVCNGSSATISAAVTGTFLAYRWQMAPTAAGPWVDLFDNATYAGTQTATLTVRNVTPAMSGYVYRLIVNGICSPANVVSAVASLTVNTPAIITTQPEAAKAVCAGSPTSFTASVSGNSLSYQWQASTDGGITFTNISGATAATLSLPNATLAMNGNRYRVVTATAACSASTSMQGLLTVNPLPVVTIAAAPTLSVQPGMPTYLSVGSTPKAASYAWTLNGAALPNGTGSTVAVNYAGAGTYQATVTDVNGCTGSSNTVLIENPWSSTVFIFPNPNNGNFRLRCYANWIAEGVQIYNAAGALVFEKKYSPGLVANVVEDFSLPGLARGLYTVRIPFRYGKAPATGSFVVQ